METGKHKEIREMKGGKKRTMSDETTSSWVKKEGDMGQGENNRGKLRKIKK